MAEPAKELKDWLVDVNDDDLVGVDAVIMIFYYPNPMRVESRKSL